MRKMHLKLITPERTLLEEEVYKLSCPTLDGQITILPGHANLVSALQSGELIAYDEEHGQHFLHVAGGFVHITDGANIIVLADSAEHHHEIDISRSEEALAEARQIISKTDMADEEYAMAVTMIQKNMSRIKIARKHAHRRTGITSEGVFHQ